MNKEEIIEFLENNLEIETEKEWQYYQDYPDIIIKILLNGKVISKDRV